MTAIHPLNVAIDTVLTGAGLRYFAGVAPINTPIPYIVSRDDQEEERNYVQQPGNDSRVNLHMWAATKMAVLALYGQVEGLLHRQPISVTGHELERGRVRLLAALHDEPTNLHHVIAEFRTETVAT